MTAKRTYYQFDGTNLHRARMTRRAARDRGWFPDKTTARRRHVGVAPPSPQWLADANVVAKREERRAALKTLNRDAIRKLSAKLEIPGRGSLNKDPLIEAILDAERNGRR